MNLKNINIQDYIITSPYPELITNENADIEVDKNNKELINLFIDSYAGRKGEFTALSQYIYQHFILNPQQEINNISKAMEKISINEMKHLDILSQILLLFGVDPKFCKYIDNNTNLCNYWSAANINYQNNIKEFFKYNISLEEDAIKEYEYIYNILTNENIKEIISRILEDEHAHLKFFNDVYSSL